MDFEIRTKVKIVKSKEFQTRAFWSISAKRHPHHLDCETISSIHVIKNRVRFVKVGCLGLKWRIVIWQKASRICRLHFYNRPVANYRQGYDILAVFFSIYYHTKNGLSTKQSTCLVCYWLSTDIFASSYVSFKNPTYYLIQQTY